VDAGTDLTFLKTGRGAVRVGDARVEVDVLLRGEWFLRVILEDFAKLLDAVLRCDGRRRGKGQVRVVFSKIYA